MKYKGDYLPRLNNIYTGNEELVKDSELSDFELYNLKTDRRETTDLVAENPVVFKQMKRLLEKEYKSLLEGSHIWENVE